MNGVTTVLSGTAAGAAALARPQEPSLPLASAQTIRRAVYEKARPVLVQRLRLAIYLMFLSYTLFLGQDLLFFRHRIVPLLLLKGLQFGSGAAALWALRREWVSRRAVAAALIILAVAGVLAVACSIVRDNTVSSVLLFVLATIGFGNGLPWGPRAQAAMVAIYTALLVWNHYAVDGTLLVALANPGTGVVLTAGVVSIFAAHVYERYRWQAEVHEADLRRSQAELTAVLESTDDSIWSVDRNLRIRIANAAVRDVFERLYGTDLAHGESIEERVPARVRETWQALYDRVLAGERVTTEQTFERDGAQRHYLISMCPIRENDQIVGATVFSRDITELRRTAEVARRNQAELTHVLRLGTMGEIASALAHEINQPLGAIANYAGACGRWLEAGRPPNAELRRSLEQIRAQALRAGDVVHRLRDLCRKGAGRVEVVQPNDVVRHAVELMEPQTRLEGLSLRLEAGDDLPAVDVDPIQIEQVVLNLVLNAIDAMRGNGAVDLVVRTRRHGDGVAVDVRDSGPGIGPDTAERIFEPYFTTKPQGLGMGLAISRRIVEAHGGQLSGSANPGGVGSTFSFTLPPSR